GGAARFAHAFAPGFSGQVDLWTESSGVIDSGESGVDNYTGLAGHLTARNGGAFFGGLASIGYVKDQESTFANAGLEAGADLGNLGLYLQGGYTAGIDG